MSIPVSRRQLLSAAALTTAALPVLSGCSDAAATEGAHLRFAWWGSSTRHEMTQQVIAAFTTEHPDITVEGLPGDFSGYFDRLATQTAAGDAPDIITLGGAYVAEYAQRGALLDLTTVTEQFDPSSWMDETALANGRVGEALYAATTGVNALSAIVNPVVFEDAGVEIPDDSWGWDDFARIAREITTATEDGVYGSAGVLSHDTIDCWARQRGESLYTAEGTLGLTRDTLTGLFELSRQMIDDQGAPPPSLITELDGVPNEQTLMGTNRAGMHLGWSSALAALADAAGSDLILLPLPGEQPTPGLWLQSSQYYSINADSAHPREAALLIDFMLNSPEAGQIVKTDRGVPANPAIREAIGDDLPRGVKVEVDYIAQLGEQTLQPLVIGPAGSTAVADITTRVLTEVAFGRITPQEAAEQWFTEAEQAIR